MDPTTSYSEDDMPAKRRFSQSDIARITLLYSEGKTMYEIAPLFGCHKGVISRVLRENGIILRKPNNNFIVLTSEQEKNLVDQFHKGCSLPEISKNLGLSGPTITRLLKSKGLQFKRGGRYKTRPESERHERGTFIDVYGHCFIQLEKDDPFLCMTKKNRYCAVHRLVMARHLGRPLSNKETVHHINGDKTDNRIENLQIRNGPHGRGVCLRCGDCGSRNIVHEEI